MKSCSLDMSWLIFAFVFMLSKETTVTQSRPMSECHSFVDKVSRCFAESEISYFYNVMATHTGFLCITNIFSFTF